MNLGAGFAPVKRQPEFGRPHRGKTRRAELRRKWPGGIVLNRGNAPEPSGGLVPHRPFSPHRATAARGAHEHRPHLHRLWVHKIKFRRQFRDCGRIPVQGGGPLGQDLALGIQKPGHRQSRIVCRRRECQHRRVTVAVQPVWRLGQGGGELAWPFHGRFAPRQFLHAPIGSDPGAAASRPAGTVEANLDPALGRLADGQLHQVIPFRAAVRDLACRMDADIEQQDTAHADILHALEVRDDPLAGDIAVHPIPIAPGPGFARRLDKAFHQRLFRP